MCFLLRFFVFLCAVWFGCIGFSLWKAQKKQKKNLSAFVRSWTVQTSILDNRVRHAQCQIIVYFATFHNIYLDLVVVFVGKSKVCYRNLTARTKQRLAIGFRSGIFGFLFNWISFWLGACVIALERGSKKKVSNRPIEPATCHNPPLLFSTANEESLLRCKNTGHRSQKLAS